MKTIFKEFQPLPASFIGANQLKIDVYYNAGGMNYFTGKVEARGYYMSVSPVNREERPGGIVIESYAAFSGIKTLLNEVKRQSGKAEAEALKLAESKKQELINYILNK